eukprot:COSAG03_NODE_7914_length_855_cov_3.800528_3_plen_25_part_01
MTPYIQSSNLYRKLSKVLSVLVTVP